MRKFDKPALEQQINRVNFFIQEANQHLKNDDLTKTKQYLKAIEYAAYIPLRELSEEREVYHNEPLAIEKAELALQEISPYFAFARDYLHTGHARGLTHSLQAIHDILKRYFNV